MTHLMIVESPNKCNIIESYLGQGWIVKASMGHVHFIVLQIVVDREQVIRQFKPIDYVEVWILLETDGVIWQAKWKPGDLIPESQKHWTDTEFVERVARFQDVKVVWVEKTQYSRHPPPPFITSIL